MNSSVFTKGVRYMTHLALKHIPACKRTPPSAAKGVSHEIFGFKHPDLDKQNVFVDKLGNVTGIIDWDGVRTGPSWLSWAGLPMWLCEDFEADYVWPAEYKHSPEEMDLWRDYYARCLRAATGDEEDYDLAGLAAPMAAFDNAIYGVARETGWAKRLYREIVGRGDEEVFLSVLGECGWDDDAGLRDVEARLKSLFDGSLMAGKMAMYRALNRKEMSEDWSLQVVGADTEIAGLF